MELEDIMGLNMSDGFGEAYRGFGEEYPGFDDELGGFTELDELTNYNPCPDKKYSSELRRKVQNHVKNSPAYISFSKELKKSIRLLYLESADSNQVNELDTPDCIEYDSRLKELSDKVGEIGPVLNSSDGSKVNLERDILTYMRGENINENGTLYKILKYGTPTTSQSPIRHQS